MKQTIASERVRQSSLHCSDGNDDSLKMEDSVNFASDSVRKKKRESEARSSVRCWKCNCKSQRASSVRIGNRE